MKAIRNRMDVVSHFCRVVFISKFLLVYLMISIGSISLNIIYFSSELSFPVFLLTSAFYFTFLNLLSPHHYLSHSLSLSLSLSLSHSLSLSLSHSLTLSLSHYLSLPHLKSPDAGAGHYAMQSHQISIGRHCGNVGRWETKFLFSWNEHPVTWVIS